MALCLDEVREGDRAKVLELQKRAGFDFPLPDTLTGYVVRDGPLVLGWAGYEFALIAEAVGIIDPSIAAKDKVRIWASLHKPVEEHIVQTGVNVAYAHIKTEHSKFAAVLNFMGWKFCPGLWMRRESVQGLNPSDRCVSPHKS